VENFLMILMIICFASRTPLHEIGASLFILISEMKSPLCRLT
jgi:hypothetical protein